MNLFWGNKTNDHDKKNSVSFSFQIFLSWENEVHLSPIIYNFKVMQIIKIVILVQFILIIYILQNM